MTVTTPTHCNLSAKPSYGEPVYKFQVSSFSHSWDILGGNKNLNGSRDHNHTWHPFQGRFRLC